MVVLISYRLEKSTVLSKKDHFTTIKGLTQDMKILNIYSPNT